MPVGSRRAAGYPAPLTADHGLRRLNRGDRIGMAVHELPDSVLGSKDAGDPLYQSDSSRARP